MVSASIFQTLAGTAAGLLISIFFGGYLVRELLKCVEAKTKPADSDLDEVWRVIFTRSAGGPYLGAIEQVIFFTAFWTQGWLLVGSWLAFKVASKWQSWGHLANLPPLPATEGADAMNKYVIRRHQWAGTQYIT